jgi:omega-hydroxy-beta-dihydromenaquinone-9 sulfotransferase
MNPPGGARSSAEYVFVVGLSRSGTTLMRRILNAHPDVAIGPENHYLGHLLPFEGVRRHVRHFGDLRDDTNVLALVGSLYGGGLQRAAWLRAPSSLWTWMVRRLPADELTQRLLAGERSERGVFTAMLEAYADRRGGKVKGEKTPAHLLYVDTLMSWFPAGVVIHVMRDPRGVFVSELRRRQAAPGGIPYRWLVRLRPALTAFVLVETTLLWAVGARRARTYRRRYPERYRLVKFERLVSDPQREVRAICRFIGVGYDPAMLDQVVVSHGARLGQRGIDAAAADRWRDTIAPWADHWFRRFFSRQLASLGYEAHR